jgi:hypothetical protein
MAGKKVRRPTTHKKKQEKGINPFAKGKNLVDKYTPKDASFFKNMWK